MNPTSPAPNVALYCRVSTEADANGVGQSLAPQQLELREYCRRQGWPIVAEFEDVISGTKEKRPGLDALLAAAERREIDVVLVVKLDRLGRSLGNVIRLVEKLADEDCGVICITQGIDTRKDSTMGQLMLGVLAVVAQFERNLIRDRTVAGLAVAKAKGKVLGRPSERLVGVDVAGVVRQWRVETGGKGLRRLAAMLGGVAIATAARLSKVTPT